MIPLGRLLHLRAAPRFATLEPSKSGESASRISLHIPWDLLQWEGQQLSEEGHLPFVRVYSRALINDFVSRHPELVLEDPPTITLVSQIDPRLDLDEGPIDLLYRFSDDQQVALAFEHAVEDIYTARFVADRIDIVWVDEMD